MRRRDIRMDNKALQDEFAALYEGQKMKSMTGSSVAKRTFSQNAIGSAATLKLVVSVQLRKEHENG